ncbi:MAG: hypothetical protein K2U26_19975 [Cyclobacteriaceae bacterium]|nr:hypothetical protein [Cyclobacteriaceae bacterium]
MSHELQVEKEEVLRKFSEVKDISLIRAINSLLDFGLQNQWPESSELEASIEKGLQQSLNDETIPHEIVMLELRERFKK